MSLKDDFKNDSSQNDESFITRRSISYGRKYLNNSIKDCLYLRPIKLPSYCQSKKRGRNTSNFGKKLFDKNMCQDLVAAPDENQSENFSDDKKKHDSTIVDEKALPSDADNSSGTKSSTLAVFKELQEDVKKKSVGKISKNYEHFCQELETACEGNQSQKFSDEPNNIDCNSEDNKASDASDLYSSKNIADFYKRLWKKTFFKAKCEGNQSQNFSLEPNNIDSNLEDNSAPSSVAGNFFERKRAIISTPPCFPWAADVKEFEEQVKRKRTRKVCNDFKERLWQELKEERERYQSENISDKINNIDTNVEDNSAPVSDADNFSRTRRSLAANKLNNLKQPKQLLKENSSDYILKIGVKSKNKSQQCQLKKCEVCNQEFNNSHDLTIHLKDHNSVNNTNNKCINECQVCHKRLSSKSSLDRHILTHSGYKPHRCDICGVFFTTNGNMNRHMRIHENDKKKKIEDMDSKDKPCVKKRHICKDDCHHGFLDLYDIEFSSNKFPKIARVACEKEKRCPPPNVKKIRLDEEVRDEECLETVRNYNCNVCEHCFPCLRTLTEHIKECSKCKICKIQFSTFHEFETHMLTQDSEHNLRVNTEHGEEKNNFLLTLGLNPLKDLNEDIPNCHQQSFDESSKCSILEESDSNEALVIDEEVAMINSRDPLTDFSDFPTMSAVISLASQTCTMSILKSPITASRASPQSTDEIPASPVQGSANSLPNFDKNDNSNSSVDSDSHKNKFKCVKCLTSFENLKALRSHAKSHMKNKIYKCERCPYTSGDKSTVKRHMSKHTGHRPFKCNICNFAFTTKTNTERHIKAIHHILPDQAESHVAYNREMSDTNVSGNVTSENASETVCKYCKIDFNNPRLLKHHLRSVSNSCSRKPFICKKCHSGFSTKNNCIRHINHRHAEYRTKVDELVIFNKPTNDDPSEQSSEAVTDDEQSQISVQKSGTNGQEHSDQNVNDSYAPEINEFHNSENERKNLFEDIISQQYSGILKEQLNTSDEVSAVDGLMSLSKSTPFQNQPLDLSLRPIDLSSNNSVIIHDHLNPKQCMILHSSSSTEVFLKRQPAHISVPEIYPPDIQPARDINQEHVCSILPSSTLNSLVHIAQNINFRSDTVTANSSVSDVLMPSMDYSMATENTNKDSCTSETKMVSRKLTPNKKSILCCYCEKSFTLKSNRDRHIKHQHPERARPPRSRNFIPLLQGNLHAVQKQIQNVSDITRDRLRSVLIPKVYNNLNTNEESMDEEAHSLGFEKNEESSESSNKIEKGLKSGIEDEFLKNSSENDFENNDLASVSSVINTANSKEINKFLNDASLSDGQSSSEKTYNTQNGISEIKTNGKEKQFECKYCGRAFNYSSARERHMATHTGEKPYICSKCGTRFSTKSNKDRHEKKNCCEKTNYRIKNFLVNDPLENLSCDLNSTGKSKNHHPDNNGADKCETLGIEINASNIGASTVNLMNSEFPCLSSKKDLECKFCKNNYKNSLDLTNHIKQLHPLEYKSLIGERFELEDTIQSWKKNGTGKRKIF